MKCIYYYTPESEDTEIVLQNTALEALAHTKQHNLPYVNKVKMTDDAIIRLHNGGGGYIEEETRVWVNYDKTTNQA